MRLVLDYRLRIDSDLLLRYAHALADIKVEGSILPSIRDIDLNHIKHVLVG